LVPDDTEVPPGAAVDEERAVPEGGGDSGGAAADPQKLANLQAQLEESFKRARETSERLKDTHERLLRTAAELRINACRPASVIYAITGIGRSRSGPTVPSPLPPSRWQGKQLAINTSWPRRTDVSSGTDASTAIVGQRWIGEGTTLSAANE